MSLARPLAKLMQVSVGKNSQCGKHGNRLGGDFVQRKPTEKSGGDCQSGFIAVFSTDLKSKLLSFRVR